jgi:ankyrin repeat protein
MNALMEAILIGTGDKVRRLLNKHLLEDQDNLFGQSALHPAVLRPQYLAILLDSGADVNARDRYDATPLMYLMATGNTQVAIRLLDSGADPFLVDHSWQRDFLSFARARKH